MSTTENIIPAWVRKRRYSLRLNWVATIILGLFFGVLGLAMILAAFHIRSNIENVCTSSYVACSGVDSPGSPLGNALSLLDIVTVLAAPIAAGGLAYALGTWLQRSSKWAAILMTQPLAQHLQQWYSQGKLTKQQADELLADLASTIHG